jgi:hypothetical protein
LQYLMEDIVLRGDDSPGICTRSRDYSCAMGDLKI